jgi:hypothetical protein
VQAHAIFGEDSGALCVARLTFFVRVGLDRSVLISNDVAPGGGQLGRVGQLAMVARCLVSVLGVRPTSTILSSIHDIREVIPLAGR